MKISFAITSHNEAAELQALIGRLKHVRTLYAKISIDMEIVVLDDFSDVNTLKVLRSHEGLISFYQRKFNNDFAEHKNYLISLCKGDWIYQLDADELIDVDGAEMIPNLLALNPDVEAWNIPRINIVDGITDEHIKAWRWTYTQIPESNNEKWINYPDHQLRLFKNDFPRISFQNKVHERIYGFKTEVFLPGPSAFDIIHIKNIKKQEQQNELYSKIN